MSTSDGTQYDSETSESNVYVQQIVQSLENRRLSWKKYGRHTVLLNGWVVIAPIRPWWWLLQFYLLILTITFIYERTDFHLWVFGFGIIISFVVFASIYKTLFCDPGIIKRPSFDKAILSAYEVGASIRNPLHRVSFLKEDGHGRLLRHTYCFRCHIFRPPNSGHCTSCHCCLEKWDHHCPVFGGCVAKKNYISFHIMVLSILVYIFYLLIVSTFVGIQKLSNDKLPIWKASFVMDQIYFGIASSAVLFVLFTLIECDSIPKDVSPDNVSSIRKYIQRRQQHQDTFCP